MKIGVDSRTLTRTHTGIGTYLFNLLQSIEHVDRENEYRLFFDTDHLPKEVLSSSSFTGVPVHFPFVRQRAGSNWIAPLWLNWALPRRAHREGIEVLFCPNFFAPLRGRFKNVITVHDLAPYESKDAHSPIWRRYFKLLFPHSVRQAWRIITISRYVKDSMVRLFGIAEERIRVIYYGGAGPNFRVIEAQDQVEKVRRKYRLDLPFILFVGTLTARKNLIPPLVAYKELIKTHDIPHHLVMAGEPGWGFDDILDTIKALGLQDHVRMIGRLNRDELPLLYNGADLLVQPGLHEGFGLPSLEAMACGVPVLASRAGALPEIVGDAGMLVPPNDVKGLAQAMERVLMDSNLRVELKQRGIQRAKQFSWDKCAQETISWLTEE